MSCATDNQKIVQVLDKPMDNQAVGMPGVLSTVYKPH